MSQSMENSATSKPENPSVRPPQRGTFYFLEIVFGAAIVLATLFTAWTPSITNSLSPNPPVEPIAAAQPTPQTKNQPTETPRSGPLVGIVAGHSGNDSGAVCPDGLTEVFVNTTIAGYVQKDLRDQGIDVVVLKEFDPRLVGFKANALISIHADSCDYINDQATGFKVAASWANPHPERSARLTACLRSRYASVTKLPLHSTSVTTDMSSYHAFGEIDENTPAAIIETGFLNLDRDMLQNHPEIPAQGITQGILCFLRNEDVGTNPVPTATTAP
jgi:N-acetylmuramoyl-L-alanine amidase